MASPDWTLHNCCGQAFELSNDQKRTFYFSMLQDNDWKTVYHQIWLEAECENQGSISLSVFFLSWFYNYNMITGGKSSRTNSCMVKKRKKTGRLGATFTRSFSSPSWGATCWSISSFGAHAQRSPVCIYNIHFYREKKYLKFSSLWHSFPFREHIFGIGKECAPRDLRTISSVYYAPSPSSHAVSKKKVL